MWSLQTGFTAKCIASIHWAPLRSLDIDIGQQQPIIVYRTGFWMCVFLVLSVIRCSCYYFLDIILIHHDFHHESCDYHLDFYGHSLLFELHFRLSLLKSLWFCKCTTPWMFPPLDILLEYWIEHVTFGFLYVMFTFSTRILQGSSRLCNW